ncbi:hypothetical protein DAEQUDRAFT_722359 [Daedalea quercina L-15889]|uniref:Uncharacterized protein n=1 Tax=Daedalea quercina L-15889 TaxID=1314783 RepID=A0A165T0D2_9APHY|nr:hypothetical protein DAEQUDRAFT_722359 [Daedalea quercina L-15889]
MPTSTVPYEILLDFVNDMTEPTTIRVLRQDNGMRTGAAMLLNSGENLSLVLTAGTPYKYALVQGCTEAVLSVKVWQDTQYCTSSAFRRSRSGGTKSGDSGKTTMQGVAVVSLDHHYSNGS